MKDQPGTLQQQQPEIPAPQQQAPLAKPTATSLKLTPIQEFLNHMQAIRESIERRAYELFERRGHVHGQDLEDWANAENEMLHPVRMELADTPDYLIARTRVSGFNASQVNVSVEQGKIAISGSRDISEPGKNETEGEISSGSIHFLEMMDLPCEVDPAQASATLKGDVLEVTLPKTTAAVNESTKRLKARTQTA